MVKVRHQIFVKLGSKIVQIIAREKATKPYKIHQIFRVVHKQGTIYPILTSIVLGFFGRFLRGSLGTVTVSTPSWHAAEMESKLQSARE